MRASRADQEHWLERNGFPKRAFIDPTPEMLKGIRRAMGAEKAPYLLGYDTLVGRLRLLSQLLGRQGRAQRAELVR